MAKIRVTRRAEKDCIFFGRFGMRVWFEVEEEDEDEREGSELMG